MNLYPGKEQGEKKTNRHQYFTGERSCQKVSVGRNKKYLYALYFDYGHIDGTEITLIMKKHVGNVSEETGEFGMCRLFLPY